jgi:hypothetical protein
LKESLSTSSRLLSTTKRFQFQLLRQCDYRLPLENNFKSTLVEDDLTFALQESTQLTFLLFKASFQGRKFFFESRIRNRSFYSAGNF